MSTNPKNKIYTTVVVALILGIIGLLIEYQLPSKVTGSDFSTFKIRKPEKYSIVVAGDSRTLTGISPQEMKTILPQKSIYNFGFERAVWTNDYLEAIERKLDQDKKPNMVILGIAPRSFSLKGIESNSFKEAKRNSRKLKFQFLNFNSQFSKKLSEIFDEVEVTKKDRIHRYFHPDGWVAAKRKKTKHALKAYKKGLKKFPVSRDIVDNLIGKVREWNQKEILVVGFFPPTSKKLRAIERKYSRFDEDEFKQRFRSSGGKWISIPATDLKSNDHSHLTIESAKQFSARLAKKILPLL